MTMQAIPNQKLLKKRLCALTIITRTLFSQVPIGYYDQAKGKSGQELKKNLNKKSKNIKIKNLWVVRQFKNDYNPVHFHDGNVSGVGYLKIPNNLTKGHKKIKTNGTIDFIYGSKSFLNNSIFNHKPRVGDLILFPNNLMHTAYPFKSDGERRSFSFNIDIDKKLTELFHG